MFTDTDGIRMKTLFSLRDQRGLNDTEQKELEELVDRWEQAYFQNTKVDMASDPYLVPLELLRQIRLERGKGYAKWGHVDRTPVDMMIAIMEEVGKVAHAINHDEGNEKAKQEIAEAIGILSRLWDMLSN